LIDTTTLWTIYFCVHKNWDCIWWIYVLFNIESPHQYDERQVNIHYRTPVNQLKYDQTNEEELNRRQTEQVMHKY
jgi:hypothetical protein